MADCPSGTSGRSSAVWPAQRLWSQSRHTADRTLARQVAATAFGVRGARTRPLVVLAGPGWGNRAPGPGMLRPTGLREALDVLARHCAAVAGPFTS
ncbi:hypothetical protein ACF09Z_32080 [Streptomyces erythrochromogenes]|uniref:hypothetical protein n=1 Tax=Streptomyces erythrochromogenes TaxID=285574 RepID=UPI0036FFCC34